MATYPIKMLKDENNIPFVPLVGANAIVYNDTETLEEKLDKKLEKTNIIAGDNITLSIDGNNITINGGAGSSITLIDNLTASMAGQGALDAHQGYVLKGMIDNLPRVIDDITSTSQTDALSANQGRVLNINKQDKLISGTNIKTIGGNSILGSGNIDISGDTLPIGSIIPYGSSTTPSNWLKCDGSAVSRTTYSELFSVIGTLYGSGDGSTTFNLPNLKGKVTIGQDTIDTDFNTIGKTGGEKEHTLTIDEMPAHNHNLNGYTDMVSNTGNEYYKTVKGSNSYGIGNTKNSGGDQAHNNLQPYQVVAYWKRIA